MKAYEDPSEHLNRHMEKAAHRFTYGLKKRGMQPNAILTRAFLEREMDAAQKDYERSTDQTFKHNITILQREHKRRLNEIKRDGFGVRVHLPIAAFFGLLAVLAWAYPGIFIPGATILFAVGALAFVAIPIAGAIFDRPVPLD